MMREVDLKQVALNMDSALAEIAAVCASRERDAGVPMSRRGGSEGA